ncbi:Hypothetical Protein [Arabidopsis thaliana]|uniref:At1g19680 n=4 Tax=Arabidopsis TaxID=3701 RepID=Q9FXG6_ARATH|nr:RING/U-box superfamily protein [Arabidopsis thaliana]KAG7654878.1 Zinc finger RING-type [Arabidopsis suecica]AAG12558.1 Hypothetical Protein [Arabidopsis thaliana]AAY57584.1 RING finger family protein [Arabidopsis thaliana]ABJ17105.1 At1g19680 [Arabidopsis thaliana]AEE29882.1 RING/U-box superfamily protein [Arabidopsis thaliana]|eukprot:NP_173398.2 RING/U-box superfamily protein [Arabidopsis thaliana]
MGSVCCVAAKDRNVPSGAIDNSVCSPSWSFRRDNRRRVADEIKDSSNHNVGSRGIDIDKLSLGLERGPPSSETGGLATLGSQKSADSEMGTASMVTAPLAGTSLAIRSPSDVSLASPVRVEVKNIVDSSDIVSSVLPNPSSSTSVSDLPSAHTHSLPPRSTPSRRARGSPGQQLFRQVSDSQTLGLKSPNNYSTSEGRSSFVLSTCSNDTATGSHFASSEGGWSINAFCELVAQSQRERWSFDNEHLGSGRRRLSGCSSSRFSCSPSVDQQTCGRCSKLLTERSPVARFDLPIPAVLACGHVYHAACLETMTNETEKYDPTCPICTETQVTKLSRKALKAEAELKATSYKRCKNRVVDSYVRSECEDLMFQNLGKREGKGLKMDPSSNTKGSTSKSFMKWHFGSVSTKWSKARDSTSKKSFWSRHSNKRLSHSFSSVEGLNQAT